MRANRTWAPTVSMAGLALLLLSCGNQPKEADMSGSASDAAAGPKKVLFSRIAGSWYTADRDTLIRELTGYMDKADTLPLDNVCALLLPHAGYRFSGQTAAYGIKQVAGRQFDRVIVLGPSHRVGMQDMCSVPDVTHYATPLGEIPLDTAFIRQLKTHPEFRTVPAAHEGEHSVQIEVPLLQAALGDFTLVPIVVGQLGLDATRRIANILTGMLTPRTLVVVSTDFTHYGTGYGYVPFTENAQENIEKLDMAAFEFVKRRDLAGFYHYIDKTGATICGRCPVAILLGMLPEGAEAHLLHYDTSGRIMNDRENSVSYVCAAFTGTWPEGNEMGEPEKGRMGEHAVLGAEDKLALLRLARGTLTHALEKGKRPLPEDLGIDITPGMKQVMGAFVTLHKDGQLRGCIGEIFPQRELYKAVIDHAINAGLNDGRFRPVTAAELKDLDFEISALTPPEPVGSWKDIVIGKHGMVIRKGGRQAVFLPQVAPEQGWGIEETLTHLSVKAGLPPDAWKSGAEFVVFEAIVFGEEGK